LTDLDYPFVGCKLVYPPCLVPWNSPPLLFLFWVNERLSPWELPWTIVKRRLHDLFADGEWMGDLRKTVGFVFVGACLIWERAFLAVGSGMVRKTLATQNSWYSWPSPPVSPLMPSSSHYL
jgi:hypothetical protein